MPRKQSFWHFRQSDTLPGSVNMKASPNVWNKNTFQITRLYSLWVHRQFKDESCTIGYIPQLNRNWIAYKRAKFFNGFELHVKLEFFRSSYFGSKSWFCYSACIVITIRLRGRNLYILQSPTIKLKLEMWEIGSTVFLNAHEKINF